MTRLTGFFNLQGQKKKKASEKGVLARKQLREKRQAAEDVLPTLGKAKVEALLSKLAKDTQKGDKGA